MIRQKNRLRKFLVIVTGLFVMPFLSLSQYSITGNQCAFPEIFYGPYQINGGWAAGDKWCVTGGVFADGSTCFTVPSGYGPSIGVTWYNSSTQGTLSYYHPGTASSPVATLPVTILSNSIGISQSDYLYPFIPTNTIVNFTFTGSDVNANSCAGPISYQWQISLNNPNNFSNIPGATGRNYTATGPYTGTVFSEDG